MIISHRCKLIFLFDSPTGNFWLETALAPWLGETVSEPDWLGRRGPYLRDLTPTEARSAFVRQGLDFDSYTRIGVVQNPFRRMAALYERLCAHDPLWRLRQRTGRPIPEFRQWILDGRFAASGRMAQFTPRWRKLGAMSTTSWAAGEINHFLRSEFVATDLRILLRQLATPPAIYTQTAAKPHRFAELLRYDAATVDVIRKHFGRDLQLYRWLASDRDIAA